MSNRDLQRAAKPVFMDDVAIQTSLKDMERDASLNTEIVYRKDFPVPLKPQTFKQKHTGYLKGHPKVNPAHYLSNLRAMIKIRAAK
jgi:hypothetical protein